MRILKLASMLCPCRLSGAAMTFAVLGAALTTPAAAGTTGGAPTLSVDNGGCSVVESSGPCVFTLRLSTPSNSAVSFNTSLQGGSASAVGDFGSIAATGQINAGATTTSVSVAVVGESIYEFDENFTLNISNVQNANPTSLTATGTIINDDAAPAFSVGACVVTEGNTGSTACNFPVTLVSAAQRPVAINYQSGSPGNLLAPASDASLESPLIGTESGFYGAGTTFGAWQVESGNIELKSWMQWQAAHYRQSLDLHGNAPGTIGRDVATVPGQRYLVSFAQSGHPVCALAVTTFNASFGGQALGDFTFDSTGFSLANMGWRYEAVAVTATTTNSRLRFASTTMGGCGPALDDISVTPIGAASSGIDFVPAWRHYEDPLNLAPGATAHTVTVNVIADTIAEGFEDFDMQVCLADGGCQTAAGGIDDDDGPSEEMFRNGFE